ncbi:MAG: DUF5103 domain-containing protein [Chitinophagales bacterium]
MRIYKAILLSCFCWIFITANAQTYENKVFSSTIKTVQLFPTGYEMAMPIIQLNTTETLDLHFDDLSTRPKTFYYTVVQCNSDWKPSSLNVMEYVDGFTESTINDYQYSNGTKVNYVHYKMQFPNFDMKVTKSGNYALIVYETNKDNPTFVKRFMVNEPKVVVDAGVAYPRNMFTRDKYQEVVFTVNHKGFPIDNAQMEVSATILQNYRWDNAKTNVKPLLVNTDVLNFNFNDVLTYPTGREFRQFDIRSIRFRGENVKALNITETENNFYLRYDVPQQTSKYQFYRDLNGLFYNESYENPNYFNGADYCNVYFNLAYPNPLQNGNFYVVGAFNNYTCDDNSKMYYNLETQSYLATIQLKQGLYNYSYIFKDETTKIEDQTMTEGFYVDTENDYTILIYYTPFGERYDRLIAVKHINSIQNRY